MRDLAYSFDAMKDLDDHLSSSCCELRLGGSMVACRLLDGAA